MRYIAILGILTLVLMLVPGFISAEHVIDDSTNPGYLFVISGTSGSLEGDTLRINGAPNVIYFSDRPVRKAGHMGISKFVEMWDIGDESFKVDPPNAVLSILNKDSSQNAVVELKNVKEKEGVLYFKVSELEGEIPASFNVSALYIDTGNDVAQQL